MVIGSNTSASWYVNWLSVRERPGMVQDVIDNETRFERRTDVEKRMKDREGN